LQIDRTIKTDWSLEHKYLEHLLLTGERPELKFYRNIFEHNDQGGIYHEHHI
jgi:hypothetical protein